MSAYARAWNRAEAEPLGYWLFFLDRAPTQVTEGVLGVRTAEFVIHPNDGSYTVSILTPCYSKLSWLCIPFYVLLYSCHAVTNRGQK